MKPNAYLRYENKTQKEYKQYKQVKNDTTRMLRQIKIDYWERFTKHV